MNRLLLVLFLSSLNQAAPASIEIDQWTGSTTQDVVAEALQADQCGSPAICNYKGFFELLPAK